MVFVPSLVSQAGLSDKKNKDGIFAMVEKLTPKILVTFLVIILISLLCVHI